MRSRYLRRFLFALFVLWCIPTLTAQSSSPILPGSEPIWQSLNQFALTLPNNYDSFMASLTGQINSLQASNQSLQDSNDSLQTSNKSLTLRNEDLQNSLQISQQAVVTSENKSALLQKALDDSTKSITRVEADARALTFGKSLAEYIAFAGVGAAGGAVASKGNLVDTAIGAAAGVALKAFLALTHLF